MLLTIIIAFISLIGLIILHELGHFLLAKKFGVKVEEFGLGYPPRLFGKKFGETIYSLNLLPLGAFVKLYGHEERIDDPRSFTTKPFWQKALIILGGVISFWVVAAILLTIVMYLGIPTQIGDDENHNLVEPKVQIMAVAPASPAEKAGIKVGDAIIKIKNEQVPRKREQEGAVDSSTTAKIKNISKIKEVQELTEKYKGQEIALTIQRGKEIFDVSLIPRETPPKDEGAMGVALIRTALKSYSWYQAPVQGILATGNLTRMVIEGWGMTISSLFQGKGIPAGVELRGPVGIFELFAQVGSLGLTYFLHFIALISICLALINVLPIPSLDGGWLFFLVIEKIKGKPVSQKIEQKITVVFFCLLITLMIYVTIKDIARIF